MKCPLCTKELSNRREFSYHITKNHSELNIIEKETLIVNTVFSEENVKAVEEGYIAEKYPITDLPIDIAKYLTLKGLKRTASEEKKTSRYKEKYITTMLSKYGVDNVSKLESIKQKKMETYISNFTSKEEATKFKYSELLSGFKEYLKDAQRLEEVKEKTRQSLLVKYGVDNIAKIPEVRQINSIKSREYMASLSKEQRRDATLNARKAVVSRGGGLSKPEKYVRTCLENNGYIFKTNIFIEKYNFDIVFEDGIIVEVNGDMWHANPLYYSEDDLIMNKLKASDIWLKDKIKKEVVEALGYKVIYIWEHETKTTEDLLIKLITKRILDAKTSNNTESASTS